VTASESRDGNGAGDCDKAYAWGHPQACLTIRQQARLTILRGYCKDTLRGGEARNCATGDLAYTEQTDAGLFIPK
jgi:hypothetical protein